MRQHPHQPIPVRVTSLKVNCAYLIQNIFDQLNTNDNNKNLPKKTYGTTNSPWS